MSGGTLQVYPLVEPPHACSYLAQRQAQFESYFIPEPSAEGFVDLIERGFRHFGAYFFRPVCAGDAGGWCGACVPLRVDVATFQPSRSQRRVGRLGEAVEVELGTPRCDAERFAIYQAHNQRFGPLSSGEGKPEMDYEAFEQAFYSPFPFTRECSYTLDGRLIAFSLLDVAPPLASSIYCAFDPAFEALSPGTLSVLREIKLARSLGLAHYHLGYSMQANASLAYKLNFRPSQHFDGAGWRPLRDAAGGWAREPESLRTNPYSRIIPQSTPGAPPGE